MKQLFSLCLLMWTTSLLYAQPNLLKDIRSGFPSAFEATEEPFININDVLYFAANNGTLGTELWRTDGTSNGTYFVTNINPSYLSSSPKSFIDFNGLLVFSAEKEGLGREIWISGGLHENTKLLKDINEELNESSNPRDFVVLNNSLYFSSHNGFKSGLWKTDGTTEGTVLIKEVRIKQNTLAVLGNQLIFNGEVTQDDFGQELWISDGTIEGTNLLKDINTGNDDSNPENFYQVGNELFFTIDEPNTALWKTDGTSGGTQKIMDAIIDNKTDFVVFKNELYFDPQDENIGYELWKTDGTNAGTILVKDINPMADGENDESEPEEFFVHGNHLYFVAKHKDFGKELWRTDGTNEGTELFVDLDEGNFSSFSTTTACTAIDDVFFFVAAPESLETGHELWQTDGTPEGTIMLADLNEGTENAFPTNLTTLNNQLIFIADNGINGRELWSYGESSITALENTMNAPQSLHLYPNPSTGSFQITLPNTVTKINATIKNMVGQTIAQYNNITQSQKINIPQTGLYFIECSDGSTIWIEKIMIK